MLTRNTKKLAKATKLRQFSSMAYYRDLQDKYVAHSNQQPAPVVIERGEGSCLFDTEGKRYIDMIAGNGSVSQGHCHPRLTEAIIRQSIKINMTSRSLLNTSLPAAAKYICDTTGYDMWLPQSTGSEACEAAVKLARKWAYTKKGVQDGHGDVLFTKGSSWGISIAAGATAEGSVADHFGPHTPGIHSVEYNDARAVENYLK